MLHERQARHGVEKPMPVAGSSITAVSPCVPTPPTHDAGGISMNQTTAMQGKMVVGRISRIAFLRERGLSKEVSVWVPWNQRSSAKSGLRDLHPEEGPWLMAVLSEAGAPHKGVFGEWRAVLPVKENPPGSFSTSDKIVSRIESTSRP